MLELILLTLTVFNMIFFSTELNLLILFELLD